MSYLPPIFEDYVASLADAPFATKRARRSDLRTICAWWEHHHQEILQPAHCTSEDIEVLLGHLHAQGTGAASIRRIIQTGRHGWAWLIAEGSASENPFHAVRFMAKRGAGRQPLSEAAFIALLAEARNDPTEIGNTNEVFLLLLRAGLRPAEVVAARVSDLDMKHQAIIVRDQQGALRSTWLLNEATIAVLHTYVYTGQCMGTEQLLTGQYVRGQWQALSVDTLRRRLRHLRHQTAATLVASAGKCDSFTKEVVLQIAKEVNEAEPDWVRARI